MRIFPEVEIPTSSLRIPTATPIRSASLFFTMEAQIKVTEAMLAKARELRLSPDPEEAIAAAQHEIRLKAELESLRKQQQRRPKAAAAAGS